MFKSHSSPGFSILELIIGFAIAAVLFGAGFTGYVSFAKREALEAAAAAMAGGLRDARAQTLASVGGSQYSVRVEPTRFILYKGAVYAPEDPENDIFSFSSYVRANPSVEAFIFQRITGNAISYGTVDLYLASDPTVLRTITVSPTGLVDIQ